MKVTPTQQQKVAAPTGDGSADDGLPDLPSEPAATRRAWWRDRRVAVGAGYVAIVTAIAWLYGVIPFSGRSISAPRRLLR